MMVCDTAAGTALWKPPTWMAEVAEENASTEAAVATHQFATPVSSETFFTRSLITPLPTETWAIEGGHDE